MNKPVHRPQLRMILTPPSLVSGTPAKLQSKTLEMQPTAHSASLNTLDQLMVSFHQLKSLTPTRRAIATAPVIVGSTITSPRLHHIASKRFPIKATLRQHYHLRHCLHLALNFRQQPQTQVNYQRLVLKRLHRHMIRRSPDPLDKQMATEMPTSSHESIVGYYLLEKILRHPHRYLRFKRER